MPPEKNQGAPKKRRLRNGVIDIECRVIWEETARARSVEGRFRHSLRVRAVRHNLALNDVAPHGGEGGAP
jgi:hypothetical protein